MYEYEIQVNYIQIKVQLEWPVNTSRRHENCDITDEYSFQSSATIIVPYLFW